MEDVHGKVEAAETEQGISATEEDDVAIRLVAAMLAREIVDVKPQLDFSAEKGFTYPIVEHALNTKSAELIPILESLAEKAILKREFFERLLHCPRCRSVNLRPSMHCPKCGSRDIVRGRVLEHLLCKYVGIEDEFASKGRYICPKCQVELRAAGTDHRSMGLLRKCRDCSEVFNVPLLKWRCLKCSALSGEDEVKEVNVYAYSLDETKRSWLEFELQPKSQLIAFLRQHGYRVTRNAKVKGRSGGEHSIDILASRDDGVVTHDIAIGVEVAGSRIGLDRILDFDTKTYDSGLHNKILIIIPELVEEAEKFASQQRIKVLQVRDLETVLASSTSGPGRETEKKPFEFESKSQLIQYLKKRGYDVQENAEVKGRSGAIHDIDILATRDDGIITYRIAIGTEVNDKPVGLDKLFDFDDKAYDAGILDKVFIAVPGLAREAGEFAKQQRIRVFEAEHLELPVEESNQSQDLDKAE